MSKVDSPHRAKPFLKWAGGKTQLLEQIESFLPAALKAGWIKRYVEPFVGSGAVLFHLAQQYSIQEFGIFDTNQELILVYRTVQQAVEALIEHLSDLEQQYHGLATEAQRDFFYTLRATFNLEQAQVDYSQPSTARAAQFIFLNRTCYNGLFRVNAKGEFNVPFGSYRNPQICFPETLRAAAGILSRTQIQMGDFISAKSVVDEQTFVYFDPPYRPISPTSSFNAYQKSSFGDAAQRRLADLFRELDRTGAKLMLSNSDPHNYNAGDDFFQSLYAGFHINRVIASRMINCQRDKRGKITELLITNYDP
ncbi:MAG: DNA adenine methylase [Gloeomargaritaceae cyanobacterium C42_A2020_066]|nr:DNA adenine methylase [Gloeomargaritaceae cyanobacterium C42_A2020_066]